ncbi:MAG: SpoIIE family protein phosphatase, partial [Candidatus Omnitrophica bacterium]|nr:SpoIIE family protein phosphatase [Candidatus Omnitrophota bacterium]
MIRNRGIAFKLAFWILASCSLIFAGIFFYNYTVSRRIIVKNIESGAKNLALVTVNKTESILLPVERVPQNLAYFLEESPCDKEQLLKLLRSIVENNPEIYGSTIAFEPYAFEKDSLYFAPYYYKEGKEVKFSYLRGSYKYFSWDWYQIPKELNRAVWSEPYFDEGGGNIIMATYSVPFYRKVDGKRKFTGVITADISLSWLQDIVASIKIGKTGYGFLISKNGRVITHPLKGLIMNETIFDLAEERNDPALRAIGKRMIKGDYGFVPSRSILTGKKCWIVYAPLPSSGWSLGVIFPKDELMADVTRLNNIMVGIGFAGFIFLLIVIVWISRSITEPLRKLNQATKDIAKGNLEFELETVRSKDEAGELAEAFVYMRGALKKYIKELTEATASKERMESELRIAHDIQMGIVPKNFPPFPDRDEFDIYACLLPAKEVGGDFYDFFFIDQTHLCFVIGDVVGKGVPAALFMAMTKTLIKATAKETDSCEEILRKVNKEISFDNDSCMFITIFLAILDTQTGELYYTNAGHNPPFIRRRAQGIEVLDKAKSLAIGLDERTVFEKEKVVLQAGDVICLYTDGVTEAFNEGHEQFS